MQEYPRHIYGQEIVGKAWFYVMIMPKLSYSLKDKQSETMVFDIETV